ncbi:MAG TPA: hypothetical protein DDW24_08375 [Blastocatellia bacterium]|nr:hypothetical protein [Blastocatellia bacterium]
MLSGQVDRAAVRSTLMYRLHPRFHIGVEYNPKVGELHPLITIIPVTETKNRPAIIFGISSDRIGTPSGTSVYLTASKDLQHWTGLPIAPYGGIVYGSYEKKFRFIGGLNIRFPYRLTSLIQFDGVKAHPSLTYTFNDAHGLTFLMVGGKDPGMTYTFSF